MRRKTRVHKKNIVDRIWQPAVMEERKDRDVQPVNLSRTRSVIAYKVARL